MIIDDFILPVPKGADWNPQTYQYEIPKPRDVPNICGKTIKIPETETTWDFSTIGDSLYD